MTKPKHTHASRKESFECGKRLEQVVTVISDGICEYKDGHSDHTVAAELGMKVTSVQGFRSEVFGKLFVRRPKDDEDQGQVAQLKTMVDHLSATVRGLKADVESLLAQHNKTVNFCANSRAKHLDQADRFNKLVNTLQLERVSNVKHLAVPDAKEANGQSSPQGTLRLQS